MLKDSVEICDSVYGNTPIETPVLVDLINSPSVQRSKGISQFGVPDEYYGKKSFSRFEHCVGAMILVKKLGGSTEEQAAALLHDVSHPAFSHVYDWVFGSGGVKGGDEGAQDRMHKDYIENSEIATILKDHRIDPRRISDYHHFPLLERELPSLCADRVDYSLREAKSALVPEIAKNLVNFRQQIVCRDPLTAWYFGRLFLTEQRNHWGGEKYVRKYHEFSKMLKMALKKGIIAREDFLIDDAYVLGKVKDTEDDSIQCAIEHLKQDIPKPRYGEMKYKKFRYIDPPFLAGNRLMVLSEVSPDFRTYFKQAQEENKKGVLVKP